MRRALISVSNKTGVVDLARGLTELGYEVISTGGTMRSLAEAGVPVKAVSEVTGFPEILDGRVKTLHPAIHGGILAVRDNPGHRAQLEEANIQPIDLVVVNLYPFMEAITKNPDDLAGAIEEIDIGGPSMVRSAAKNFRYVTVVVNPERYPLVLETLRAGEVPLEMRLRLAVEAFQHTAAYDANIASYLGQKAGEGDFPNHLNLGVIKVQDLRYGENPHQAAALYLDPSGPETSVVNGEQLWGKELSYNNLNDANAALEAVLEFEGPAAVAVKHATPCGVAVARDIHEAFLLARDADPVSIFGGIVALNRPVGKDLAELLHLLFLEVIMAPDYTDEALTILMAKKNLRLVKIKGLGDAQPGRRRDVRSIRGGLLVQEADTVLQPGDQPAAWQNVTGLAASDDIIRDLAFAWRVVKHVRSNAIVVARDGQTLGIGGGQVNRIDPAQYALARAGEKARGAVLASDGFFPMPDVVEAAAAAGIKAIVQPGGSIKDQDSVEAAKKAGIAMFVTGVRHFRH